MISTIINIVIFTVTAVIVFSFFRKDGAWDLKQAGRAFHYFTVLSNVLCAVAALLLCLFPEAHWAWLLKYIGTAAVTVTMMTVFLFLGPSYSYKELLKGRDLFMHLITPLLAIVSFGFFEKRGLGFSLSLLGLLPVILYGLLYLYKVILAPEEKRWEDFYGFNKDGKWPVSFAAMLLGTFLICLGLMALQNR